MSQRERVVPVQPIFLANLRDHVHHNLRNAIVAGQFTKGERLNERRLAEELGVSTTPLKEALRRLETEGLVATEPRRGVRVTFGPGQAEEMALAQAALESAIARMATQRIDNRSTAELERIIDRMEAATAAGQV